MNDTHAVSVRFPLHLITAILAATMLALASGCATTGKGSGCCSCRAAKPVTTATHDGYFVRNDFEPKADESVVVVQSQREFDAVFGVGRVMGDNPNLVPANAFDNHVVLGFIKRGNALWNYRVEGAEVAGGVATLRFTATASPQPSATYACPLIVSLPSQGITRIELVVKEEGPVKAERLLSLKVAKPQK